jgi:Flp pilus assembly protein TadD
MTNDVLIARYEALLLQRPGDELALFSLGKALFDAGRFPEAETHLQTALRAKPDWMVVAMLLAKCALHRDDTAAARKLYEDALGFAIAQHHEGPEEEIRTALAHLRA